MYPNLNAEMARSNITNRDLSKLLGKCEKTIRNKLTGITPIYICEARLIVATFFPKMTIDYIFGEVN